MTLQRLQDNENSLQENDYKRELASNNNLDTRKSNRIGRLKFLNFKFHRHHDNKDLSLSDDDTVDKNNSERHVDTSYREFMLTNDPEWYLTMTSNYKDIDKPHSSSTSSQISEQQESIDLKNPFASLSTGKEPLMFDYTYHDEDCLDSLDLNLITNDDNKPKKRTCKCNKETRSISKANLSNEDIYILPQNYSADGFKLQPIGEERINKNNEVSLLVSNDDKENDALSFETVPITVQSFRKVLPSDSVESISSSNKNVLTSVKQKPLRLNSPIDFLRQKSSVTLNSDSEIEISTPQIDVDRLNEINIKALETEEDGSNLGNIEESKKINKEINDISNIKLDEEDKIQLIEQFQEIIDSYQNKIKELESQINAVVESSQQAVLDSRKLASLRRKFVDFMLNESKEYVPLSPDRLNTEPHTPISSSIPTSPNLYNSEKLFNDFNNLKLDNNFQNKLPILDEMIPFEDEDHLYLLNNEDNIEEYYNFSKLVDKFMKHLGSSLGNLLGANDHSDNINSDMFEFDNEELQYKKLLRIYHKQIEQLSWYINRLTDPAHPYHN